MKTTHYYALTVDIFYDFFCNFFKTRCLDADVPNQEHVPRTHRILTKLGISVLPDGRLCLGGKLMKGLVLPKNDHLQANVIKQIMVWYSPCIGFMNPKRNTGPHIYQINNACVLQRQNKLMKMFLKISARKSRRRQIKIFNALNIRI